MLHEKSFQDQVAGYFRLQARAQTTTIKENEKKVLDL
jgi:hypothetical protein